MKNRSVVSIILLSIITFGIYSIVLSYLQLKEMEDEGVEPKIPAVAVVLLMIFVSCAGGALLGYAANENLNQIRARRGLPAQDNMVLWLVIGIFIPMVTEALIADNINKMPKVA